MKKCPFCAEEIKEAAIKCRYCGEMLKDPAAGIEKILRIARPSLWWGRYSALLIPGLLLSVVGIGLFLILYVWVDRSCRQYLVSEKKVIYKWGILSRHSDEISISDIRSVNVRQGVWDRLFGIGNIFIGTAGTSENEIEIYGIKNPEAFKNLIMGRK